MGQLLTQVIKRVYRSYWLADYRQFIHWTYNYLGKGTRRVIPSCVVVDIRETFPEASYTYTGFKIADL